MAGKAKKDFDKEQMYRKIMPTTMPAAEEEPPRLAPQAEPEETPYRLHNYMEDMIGEKLLHTANVLDCCTCGRCRGDILALTLNQLPPAYAVTDGQDDRYLRKLRGIYDVKVSAALVKAVQQVKAQPRHGDSEEQA